MPKNQYLFCVTTLLFYYGNGITHANFGDIREAKDMQNLFEETVCHIPDTRYMHVKLCLGSDGNVRRNIVGEIAYDEP